MVDEWDILRMLGLCLVSALAVAAIAAVPALAERKQTNSQNSTNAQFGYPPVEEGFVEVNEFGRGMHLW